MPTDGQALQPLAQLRADAGTGGATPIGSLPLMPNAFVGDLDAAVRAVIEHALSGAGGYSCQMNVHVAMTARHDPWLRRALSAAWTVFPDGAPIAWLERRALDGAARRVAGPDLMPAVLDRGRGHGLRHYFLGSTPDVLSALVERVAEAYPGCEVVGATSPYPGAEHASRMLAQINDAEPHVVWVSFGAPKQELWMQYHAPSIRPAIALGVGAAFDFLAGEKKRAPAWMCRNGLEWAHRMAVEPRRLGWRYLSTNTAFLFVAARCLLTGWSS